MPALRAFLLSQGEELLTGQTVDTNAAWLADKLTALGVRVMGRVTAGDRVDAIVGALRYALPRADVVICTGGLGPTEDDLTAEAVAATFGVRLEHNEDAMSQVRARYAVLGRPMAGSNARQARLPAGCTVLENPVGTAPGFAVEHDGAWLACLPGVPSEMKRLYADHVEPAIRHRLPGAPPRRHLFSVMGRGESQLQDDLGALVARWPGVELGFRTRMPSNQVKLVADAGVAGFDDCVAAVRAALGDRCYGEGDRTELAGALGDLLLRRGESFAVAESCTGGLVAHLCVSEAGASRWFRRGWVTYEDAAKVDELGVDPRALAEAGAVSERVARQMAEGARRRAGASWAVAITGVAGPDGGTIDKPVGTVWFAVAGPDGTDARKLRFPDRGRELIRTFSAWTALDLVRRGVLGLSG